MSKSGNDGGPKTFRDLKVGDEVFVVDQMPRNQDGGRSRTQTVTKVGTKFAYVKRSWGEEPFCRKTGESHHKEWNTRANGYGFDVYLCEDDYRRKVFESSDRAKLKKRLLVSYGEIVDLPPEVVAKLNSVLDEHDATIAGASDG